MYAHEHKERARYALQGHWGSAVFVTLVAATLGGMLTSSASFNLNLDEQTLAKLPDFLLPILAAFVSAAAGFGGLQFVLGGPVRLGYCQYLLKLHDGAPAEFRDLFSQFHHFGKAFLLQLLTTLFTILWTLLFFIPGIIAGYRYSMAPFLMLEYPDLTPREALRASSNLMDGYKWNLFCLEVSFIGWAILNVFTLGIGSLWLNPYMNVSRAAFYRRITWEKRNGIY